MFFKYVYAKIQQYPYLHVVTWGLPRRYLSLFRIFNLQIEENPHLFLKQCSDYEPALITASTSNLKQLTAGDVTKYHYKIENDAETPELARKTAGKLRKNSDRNPRRFKKPSVVSIRVNLKDNLRDIKLENRKFKKGNRQNTYLFVIEKSTKNDKYSLSVVNHSPYAKLLKKNYKKRRNSVISSNFSQENIYPSVLKMENFEDKSKEIVVLPTQKVRYEEKNEEKPLRFWPTVTQLFKEKQARNEDEKEAQQLKISENSVEVAAENNTKDTTTLFGVEISTEKKETHSKVVENSVKYNENVKTEEESASVEAMKIGLFKSTFLENSKFSISSPLLDEATSKNEAGSKFLNYEVWKITYPYTEEFSNDSLVNMKLLSSSVKSYKSVTITISEDVEVIEEKTEETENLEGNPLENKEKSMMTWRIFVIFLIVVSVLIIAGVVLSATNSGALENVQQYFKQFR